MATITISKSFKFGTLIYYDFYLQVHTFTSRQNVLLYKFIIRKAKSGASECFVESLHVGEFAQGNLHVRGSRAGKLEFEFERMCTG